jgi:hypothetical protein
MDLDPELLSLIDGYVASALGETGTKKAVAVSVPHVAPRVEAFDGDTSPDATPVLPVIDPPPALPRTRAPRSSVSGDDFDDIITAVHPPKPGR